MKLRQLWWIYIVLLLCACGSGETPLPVVVEVTVPATFETGPTRTPFQPSQNATSTAPPDKPGDYPSTPERVVQAFLNAYTQNPDEMNVYLSASRIATLPDEGALALLGFSGSLNGIGVQKGAYSPDPPTSIVQVNLKVNKKQLRLRFTMVVENGVWVIDGIETIN
jgi:hypothetical protein